MKNSFVTMICKPQKKKLVHVYTLYDVFPLCSYSTIHFVHIYFTGNQGIVYYNCFSRYIFEQCPIFYLHFYIVEWEFIVFLYIFTKTHVSFSTIFHLLIISLVHSRLFHLKYWKKKIIFLQIIFKRSFLLSYIHISCFFYRQVGH